MKLSVIIVTWNSEKEIKTCLSSLKKSLPGKSEVIVVDNASADNTVDIIKKYYPFVRLFAEKKNHGFGGGNNVGIKHSRGEYVLLLNPDTKVNKKAINVMTDFLDQHDKIAAVGPEQLNEKNYVLSTMSRSGFRSMIFYLIEKLVGLLTGKYRIFFPYAVPVFMLNAGCILIRKSVFISVGLFDKKLFLYGEEPDLFGRLKKKGWKTMLLRNITIYHYRDKSISQTGKKYLFWLQSHAHLIKKAYAVVFGSSHKKTSRGHQPFV